MKKIPFYFLLASLFLGSCKWHLNLNLNPDVKPDPAKPIVLTSRQSEKLACDNAFSFNLFREVATSDRKVNAFISPLSVTMALGMLYNGTSPDARAEMVTALQMNGFSDEEINEYYQTMSQALLSIDPLTAISIANSIWCEKSYPVKQAFINVNKKYYGAEVQNLDFTLPSTLKTINNWCAQKTNNKIPTVLDKIPSEVVMYLINAVCFKSKWESQFEKKNTQNEKFTLENNTKKYVAMMDQTETFSYGADEMLQCLEMPYGNQAFSMVVILPAAGKTIDDIVNELDNNQWSTILSTLQKCEVHVKFPRFKQECEFSLEDVVAHLGMQLIFQKGGNLNRISDDPTLFVSEIKHKTFVEVNEEGTEAAAVTSVVISGMADAGPSIPIPFFANRPFLYLIKEKSTGAILFIGRMDDPQN